MSNTTLEEKIKIEEILEHSGVLNMHWGVWNDETKRKYGYGTKRQIKAPRKAGEQHNDGSKIPERHDQLTITDRARRRYNSYKERKRDAQAAEIAKQKTAQEKEQQISEREAEIQRKYGITAERYDALREATLNSHDPRVVIQGMKYLSDDELEAKITRLEKEGKVKKIASDQRTDEANTRKAEMLARQQTIPYRLGQLAVNTVKTAYVEPALRTASAETTKALASAGKKAREGLKEASKEAPVNQTKSEVKKSVDKAKDSAANVKLENDAARIQQDRAKQKERGDKLRAELKEEADRATGRALVEAILKSDVGKSDSKTSPSRTEDEEKLRKLAGKD